MIESAVADVVGPAVAAEDPDGLLDEQILILQHFASERAGFAGANLAVGQPLGFPLGAGQVDVDAVLAGGDQLGGGLLAALGVVHVVEPFLARFLDVGGGVLDGDELLNVLLQLGAALGGAQVHAEAELGVVLEQAVRPGRAVAVLVDGVGAGGGAAAVDGGAARGVGDDHAVAEQLGNQLDVGRFAAARARAGELEEGLFELAVLDGLQVQLALVLRQRLGVFPVGFLRLLGVEGLHGERLLLGRADGYAVFAAGAVQNGDLHAVLEALELRAERGLGLEGRGRVLEGFLGGQVRTDGGVRADQRAVAALDALGDVPLGNLHGDAALLVLGGAGGHAAVHGERGHGQLVAFLRENRGNDGVEVLGGLNLHGLRAGGGVQPGFGNLDFLQAADGYVDGVPVHLDDRVALLAVGLLGVGLHVFVGLLVGDDVGQLEERGLHGGVDAVAHAHGRGQGDGVDGVEAGLLLGQLALHGSGQLGLELLGAPGAVQQEHAANLQRGHHVVLGDIGRVVAGDEVGAVDQVGALDRGVAEAQVADGDAAGLLGVVAEVGLRVLIGVVADDLDGVLVGADGAVRAQTIEHAADGARGSDVQRFAELQGGVGHVVVDADGEVVLLLARQVVVNGLYHGGVEFLGAQTVAAADDGDVVFAGFAQRGADVLIQRLAQGAGFLRAVEHGDGLAGRRDGGEEVLDGEGAIQVNLHEADLFSPGGQVIDGLLDGVAAGAHGDDHALGVGRADVVEQVIASAGDALDVLHRLLNDGGRGEVILVGGFAALEVDVRVLRGAHLMRMLGVQRAAAEGLHGVPVDEPGDVFVGDVLDLLDFMAGAETVEEVEERHGRLQRGQMRDQRHILRFLHGVGGQHRKAGLTAGHNVGVISEDGQRVIGQRAGGHMEHRGQLLAGDLVHVGDHQKKSLRGGKGGGQRARDERAVNGARGARFGLHFRDFYFLTEQVLTAGSRPFVGDFRHRRRRSDRVDRRHIAERIRDMADGGIAVYGLFDAQRRGPP